MLRRLRKIFSNRLVLAVLAISVCIVGGRWLYWQYLHYKVEKEIARYDKEAEQLMEMASRDVPDVPMPTDTTDAAAWMAYIYANNPALEILKTEHEKAVQVWRETPAVQRPEYPWRIISPYMGGMSCIFGEQSFRMRQLKEHLRIDVAVKDTETIPYTNTRRDEWRAFNDATWNMHVAHSNRSYAYAIFLSAATEYETNRDDLYRINLVYGVVIDAEKYGQVMRKSELDAADQDGLTLKLSEAMAAAVSAAENLDSMVSKRDAAWEALREAAAETGGEAEDPLSDEIAALTRAKTDIRTLQKDRDYALGLLRRSQVQYTLNHEDLYRDNRIDADTEDLVRHHEAMAKSAADLEDAMVFALEMSVALPKAVERNRELAAALADRDAAWNALLAAAAAKGIPDSEIGVEKGINPNPLPDAITFPEVPQPICPACERPATEISEHVVHCEEPLHEKSYPYFRCVQEGCPVCASHTAE